MSEEGGRQYGGRYVITRRLASGGMAEVFMARDQLLGRPVALKLLHPEYARDRAFIERFRREARAAASLNDPRIVSIFDWGSDDGTYFIVMEFVEGKSLKEMIAEGPFTTTRAVEISADVCSALHAAHRRGVVHRDVKPANILITPTGETKVADFGIARAPTDSGQTVTQTGTVMGTASYLSPEQALAQPVDARSDVYSAGIVLYEMLTGDVPFKADTAVATAYKHVKEEAAPPSRLNRDMPPELDAVVLKALAKNPENRYQSAHEMRQDLMRLLRGESTEATPLLADRTASFSRVGETMALPSAGEAVRTAPQTSPGRRGAAYTLVILMFLGILVAAVALLFSLFGTSAETVEVPLVTGKPLVDAERLLEAEQLDSIVVGSEFSDSVPDGSVLNQSPEDGRKVQAGTDIELVLSKGPDQVSVPSVVNKSRAEAARLLEQAGLTVGRDTREFSDTVGVGVVLSQEPGPNQKVDRGSPVDLVVSGGKRKVSISDLTRLSESQARALIGQKGLRPIVEEVCNKADEAGLVLEQSPPAGSEVEEGSDVTIKVKDRKSVV